MPASCVDCWRRDHPDADNLNPAYEPTCEWRCPDHQAIWDEKIQPLIDKAQIIVRDHRVTFGEFTFRRVEAW